MFDRYTDTVLTNIGINIIMTLSVYFPLAVGQLSIAQVGFMAIGAHLATLLTLYLQSPLGLALLAAGLLAWGLGLLIGRLLVHLQGLTFAFATFAFMEIVQVFFLNCTLTGDARGIKGIAPLTALWQVWVVVGLLCVFFFRLRRSRIGRAMAMIKHDADGARALGVDVNRLKVTAFAAGALVAGMGGGFYAHYAMYIQYSDFGADRAMAIMTYAVFGGIDVWFGGVLGAAVLSYLPVLLQVFDHWRLEVHGAIILVVMGLRPQGVLALDLGAGWRQFRRRYYPSPATRLETALQSPPDAVSDPTEI
jgi:branched-chain amino acid transport system permease protein